MFYGLEHVISWAWTLSSLYIELRLGNLQQYNLGKYFRLQKQLGL